MRFCAVCGSVFAPNRADARYCSSPCRQQSYRARKASGDEASRRPQEPPWQAPRSFGPPSPRTQPVTAPEPALRPADEGPRTILGPRGERIDIRSLIG